MRMSPNPKNETDLFRPIHLNVREKQKSKEKFRHK